MKGLGWSNKFKNLHTVMMFFVQSHARGVFSYVALVFLLGEMRNLDPHWRRKWHCNKTTEILNQHNRDTPNKGARFLGAILLLFHCNSVYKNALLGSSPACLALSQLDPLWKSTWKALHLSLIYAYVFT